MASVKFLFEFGTQSKVNAQQADKAWATLQQDEADKAWLSVDIGGGVPQGDSVTFTNVPAGNNYRVQGVTTTGGAPTAAPYNSPAFDIPEGIEQVIVTGGTVTVA